MPSLDKMLYCASDLIESYILSICMSMVWVYVQSFYSIGNRCSLFLVWQLSFRTFSVKTEIQAKVQDTKTNIKKERWSKIHITSCSISLPIEHVSYYSLKYKYKAYLKFWKILMQCQVILGCKLRLLSLFVAWRMQNEMNVSHDKLDKFGL